MKTHKIPSYNTLKQKLFLDKKDKTFLKNTNTLLRNIFLKKEKKIIIFTGPCSIHDEKSTILYAKKLINLQKDLKNILLIMRFFFEKSRSANSWRGYLCDPFLNNTHSIEKGLFKVRKLLLKLTKLNIPVCCEFVNPNTANYFDDLISWGFIGARTSCSSFHRQFASSLNIPIGFKNSLDGDLNSCINAAIVAKSPQSFIGINKNGKISKISTNGNTFSHIVLRGSNTSTNYDEDSINKALNQMKEKKVDFPIIIDCSHGNAKNNTNNQIKVFEYILKNINNKYPILGLMLESYLSEGKQIIANTNLRDDLSITDPCISFEKTKNLLLLAEDFFKKSPHLYQD